MTSRADALRGLATGLEIALRSVQQLLEEPDADDWVDQEASPIGARRHCELARDGAFPSARKLAGHWYVRRREIDAYIEENGTPPEPRLARTEADADARIMAFRAPRRRKAG